MSKNEKLDGCEFVGARMLRNLQGQEKESLVDAKGSNIYVSSTGHGSPETGNKEKKTGPARFSLTYLVFVKLFPKKFFELATNSFPLFDKLFGNPKKFLRRLLRYP